jgi:hypothetical protein
MGAAGGDAIETLQLIDKVTRDVDEIDPRGDEALLAGLVGGEIS